MMMADSFNSFFVIKGNEGWQVSSIDLAFIHPYEQRHGVFETKGEAMQQLKKLWKQWKLRNRNKWS